MPTIRKNHSAHYHHHRGDHRRYRVLRHRYLQPTRFVEKRETLQSVIEARNTAAAGLKAAAANPGSAKAMADLGGAEGALTQAMGRLNVVMEAYPDLKASQNMQQLSEELTSTENKVAFARQSFNDAVMHYNTYRQSFPPVAVAGMFGHGQDASLLEFEDSAQIQVAPTVSF